MKGAEAEVSLATSQVYSITPSAFGVSYLEVLAEYGVEDSATQLALLSSFYICLEFVCLSAILTPSDFEISDKLDTYGDNSLHFQSDSTSRNNPMFGSLKQK